MRVGMLILAWQVTICGWETVVLRPTGRGEPTSPQRRGCRPEGRNKAVPSNSRPMAETERLAGRARFGNARAVALVAPPPPTRRLAASDASGRWW